MTLVLYRLMQQQQQQQQQQRQQQPIATLLLLPPPLLRHDPGLFNKCRGRRSLLCLFVLR